MYLSCYSRTSYIGPVLSYHEFVLEDQRMTDDEWKDELMPGWQSHHSIPVSDVRCATPKRPTTQQVAAK